ncbi:MAG: hypothetical protein M3072_12095, partial [Candidatus Dormibacteraeota bacterium]|nr:hypothetical protein [Candidatus Dormibacteraeota bacterium]
MGAPAPPELELGRKRRGGSSRSSSSITQELLLGVAGDLPPALAALVEQLLAEGEEAVALSVAVVALNRLRSTRAPLPRPPPEIRLDPRRAAACNRCPELTRCGGHADGCDWGRCQQNCASCGVRCPARADLAAWQRDVAGLGLEDLKRTFPAVPQLPPLVPVIDC